MEVVLLESALLLDLSLENICQGTLVGDSHSYEGRVVRKSLHRK